MHVRDVIGGWLCARFILKIVFISVILTKNSKSCDDDGTSFLPMLSA